MSSARRMRLATGATETDDELDGSVSTIPAALDNDAEARCRRCHRPLHTELAVAAGLGPTCALHDAAALVAEVVIDR